MRMIVDCHRLEKQAHSALSHGGATLLEIGRVDTSTVYLDDLSRVTTAGHQLDKMTKTTKDVMKAISAVLKMRKSFIAGDWKEARRAVNRLLPVQVSGLRGGGGSGSGGMLGGGGKQEEAERIVASFASTFLSTLMEREVVTKSFVAAWTTQVSFTDFCWSSCICRCAADAVLADGCGHVCG